MSVIRANKIFLLPLMVIWLALTLVLIIWSKSDIHLFLNQYHNSFFNSFFKYTTFLGDGVTPAIVGLTFLFFSFRKGFIIGAGAVFAGIIAQTLKKLVFYDVYRPKLFFEKLGRLDELYFVPGWEIHSNFSFPSGHTTTAFCLFFILSTFTSNKILKLFCLFCALIAAYSRMYLSQHFLIDVYFGAIFGVLAALLSSYLINKISSPWIDKSFIVLFQKN